MKATRGSNKDLKRRERLHRKRLTKNGCTVYGLRAKSDGVTMYVGQTRLLLERRYKFHLLCLKTKTTRVYEWWRGRLSLGDEVEIFSIEDDAVWDVSEVIWIERLRIAGNPLTNMTRGGRDGSMVKGGNRGKRTIACCSNEDRK